MKDNSNQHHHMRKILWHLVSAMDNQARSEMSRYSEHEVAKSNTRRLFGKINKRYRECKLF